jgi:group I intron endonuclease
MKNKNNINSHQSETLQDSATPTSINYANNKISNEISNEVIVQSIHTGASVLKDKGIDCPDLTPMNTVHERAKFRGKSGIYLWTSHKTGEQYVGQAVKLPERTNDYTQPAYIADRKYNKIVRTIFNEGRSNFDLTVLEVCPNKNADILTKREQYWMDTLKPQLNTSKFAESSIGVVHTDRTKAIISAKAMGHIVSQETRLKISQSTTGPLNKNFGIPISDAAKANLRKFILERIAKEGLFNPGLPVVLADIRTGVSLEFDSIRAASRFSGITVSRLLGQNNCVVQTPNADYLLTIDRTNTSMNAKNKSLKHCINGPIEDKGFILIPVPNPSGSNNLFAFEELPFSTGYMAGKFLGCTKGYLEKNLGRTIDTGKGKFKI